MMGRVRSKLNDHIGLICVMILLFMAIGILLIVEGLVGKQVEASIAGTIITILMMLIGLSIGGVHYKGEEIDGYYRRYCMNYDEL